MPYIDKHTLEEALQRMKGTAHHMLKIWFVLKAMGLSDGRSVEIDTGNSTPALNRLFSYGDPNEGFFVPFAHKGRFMTMKSDASRSIIQTNIKNWSNRTIVSNDPTGYLIIEVSESGPLIVSKGRSYPEGLGYGENGFALSESARVSIPDLSLAAWLFLKTEIPAENTSNHLIEQMVNLLNLDNTEYQVIFIKDDLHITLRDTPLTDSEINEVVKNFITSSDSIKDHEIIENKDIYMRRIRRIMTVSDSPAWLKVDPKIQLKRLVEQGEKAILLYGPPRTGKTRAIDKIFPRDSHDRVTIQLHEGWTYENLVIGMQPVPGTESFNWEKGPLAKAIQDKKKCIVLEEINRTKISQALGEVFSLIEEGYRGEQFGISLPNGEKLWIDEDVKFFFTMNTLDESTEDVDDALLGRLACVEFQPRIEDLSEILKDKGIEAEKADKIKDFYNLILPIYPLGQGYFAGITSESDFITYYVSRIRPTLQNHFQSARKDLVELIDNALDGVFS
ncbi:AAA family ATPase [Brevibacillus parabrevis]|uniref:AAA family ATPase n=1 Tax=Brevibacillus parabrevis TaxID=54914 RepID=UPI0023804CDB|nr:AAA family ATPase [Brevibacillus parabrevis]WDV94874.1 AAA family ATPase [Brevibacillus parabrevis]